MNYKETILKHDEIEWKVCKGDDDKLALIIPFGNLLEGQARRSFRSGFNEGLLYTLEVLAHIDDQTKWVEAYKNKLVELGLMTKEDIANVDDKRERNQG